MIGQKGRIGLSLITALLIGSNAHAAQIVGADPAVDSFTPLKQYGFGGFSLDNVTVNLIAGEGNTIAGTFDSDTGEYPEMAMGDKFESSVFSLDDTKSDEATRMGYVHQKSWPLSEPTGIKIINNDTGVSNGKPENCIMGSSYLNDENTTLLGPIETPVICSSPAGANKRFSLALLPNTVSDTDPGQYGKSVDLVFNIDSTSGDHRYQVMQKVNNFTGMRLDGLTIQVLDENALENPALTLSLGIGEETNNQTTEVDLFPADEMAFYPPGLWGEGEDAHLPIGWFGTTPSGYNVVGQGTNELNTTTQLTGNYVDLFGNWLPEKWVGLGMHEVIDPLEEPVLLAYWGTTPDQNITDAPAWYYGMYDNDSKLTNFATPSQEEFDKWEADPEKYVIDDIEDLPNLSFNYIVNVGDGVSNKFIIRFIPKVSVDQTPPSYINDNDQYILPPQIVDTDADGIGDNEDTDDDNDGVLDGDDTFPLDDTESVDTDGDGTGNNEDTDDDNDGVLDIDDAFPLDDAESVDTDGDGIGNNEDTDDDNDGVLDVDDATPTGESNGGGGCTYNPNSKNFDMTFLLMMALGLFYPFRRRFIK